MSVRIIRGDATAMPLADASVHAVVCDPPYGIEFGNLAWDTFKADPTGAMRPFPQGSKEGKQQGRAFRAWCETWAAEALRVLKPGGYLLAFGAARAYHNLATAIEDAGFEMRDCVSWIYPTGFPKNHNASKAIDRHLGAARRKIRIPAKEACNPSAPGRGQEDWSVNGRPWMLEAQERGYYECDGDEPATWAAAQWDGWGTALRPSFEPCVVARKPLEGTVAESLLRNGTGAINVDGCRLAYATSEQAYAEAHSADVSGRNPSRKRGEPELGRDSARLKMTAGNTNTDGRYPPNVICLGDEIGTESRYYRIEAGADAERNVYPCPKPSSAERGAGRKFPTVKPITLMRWLVRLVTHPGGTVLDPFCGSGTTGLAALAEGRRCILIDRFSKADGSFDAQHLAVVKARVMGADRIGDDGEPEMDHPRLPFEEDSA